MARTTWPALRVTLPEIDRAQFVEWLSAAFDDHHPTAIDDHSETDGTLTVYFSQEESRTNALSRLRRLLAERNVRIEPVDVPDEGWAERSQAALTPVRVGRLTIAPPWDRPTDSSQTIVIVPSMAFGTGHHASTRLCLEALQRLDLTGRTVIDVGTGSGVLAIAALILGARSATGLDTDEDALACARENAALNGVIGRVTWERADVRGFVTRPADVVLANITGAVLIASTGDLIHATRPGGSLILSGLWRSEEQAVLDAFAQSTSIDSTLSEDDWVGLMLRRRHSPAGENLRPAR